MTVSMSIIDISRRIMKYLYCTDCV